MERTSFESLITFIYVSDMNASMIFYEDVMGFSLRLDQGTCRIVETDQQGGGLLGYCVRDHKTVSVDNFIITLVTTSVDEWHEYLVGCGIDILNPPTYNPRYKIYHFFFTDPDGNKIEIQEFRDPAW